MAGSAAVKINIVGDASDLNKALDKSDRDVGKFAGDVDGHSKKMSAAWGSFVGNVGANLLSGGLSMAGDLFSGAIGEAEESAKVSKVTALAIKNMGLESLTSADAVGALAGKLSIKTGIDDEAIQSGQNLLLNMQGFKAALAGNSGLMDQASTVATDLSAKMGGDLNGAFLLLAKGADDPIAAMNKLKKAGVSLTDQEKEHITQLQLSGDKQGAYAELLNATGRATEGSAAANSTASQKMETAIGQVKEALGTALLPIIEKVATWMGENLPTAIEVVGGWFEKLKGWVESAVDWMTKHKDIMTAVAIVISGVLVGAFVAWAISAGAAAIATLAAISPIILIGAAIAALVAGLVWAYQNVDWFHDAVDKVGSFLKDTLWPILKDTAKAIIDGLGAAFEWIQKHIIPALVDAFIWAKDNIWPVITAIVGFVVDTLLPIWWQFATFMFGVWKKVAEVIGGFVSFMVTDVWPKISDVIGWIVGVFASIASTAVSVWQWVSTAFTNVVDFVTGLPGKIATAASGLWDGIKDSFKAALNWLIDKWNGLGFKLPTLDLGPLGKVGGWEMGPKYSTALQIPRFHTGGVFDSGFGQGLALLADGETIRTTGQEADVQRKLNGGSNSNVIELHFHGPVARDSVQWVKDQVEQAVAQGHRFPRLSQVVG